MIQFTTTNPINQVNPGLQPPKIMLYCEHLEIYINDGKIQTFRT